MGSLSGSAAGLFFPRWVLLPAGFKSAVRAVLEFIDDEEAEERRLGEEENERLDLTVLKSLALGEGSSG